MGCEMCMCGVVGVWGVGCVGVEVWEYRVWECVVWGVGCEV